VAKWLVQHVQHVWAQVVPCPCRRQQARVAADRNVRFSLASELESEVEAQTGLTRRAETVTAGPETVTAGPETVTAGPGPAVLGLPVACRGAYGGRRQRHCARHAASTSSTRMAGPY
jgi:hypothetical protein